MTKPECEYVEYYPGDRWEPDCEEPCLATENLDYYGKDYEMAGWFCPLHKPMTWAELDAWAASMALDAEEEAL